MRISDWSSDVCSSDLAFAGLEAVAHQVLGVAQQPPEAAQGGIVAVEQLLRQVEDVGQVLADGDAGDRAEAVELDDPLAGADVEALVLPIEGDLGLRQQQEILRPVRSDANTSELQ